MARAKKGGGEEKGASGESGSGRWMLTYLDMITLLFGLFVILYAMSKVDQTKFQIVAESLRAGFQGGSVIFPGKMTGGESVVEDMYPRGYSLRWVEDNLYGIISAHQRDKLLRVSEEERGIVVHFMGTTNFEDGSDELTPDMVELLEKIAPVLKQVNSNIRVEGHAGHEINREYAQVESRFNSDWELAAGRAIRVIRFLAELGVEPDKMSGTTFGDTRPISKEGTPEAQAVNKRVDIVILVAERYKKR